MRKNNYQFNGEEPNIRFIEPCNTCKGNAGTEDEKPCASCNILQDSNNGYPCGYNSDGYDKEGYDRDGYDEEGYDRDGYNREGYVGNR